MLNRKCLKATLPLFQVGLLSAPDFPNAQCCELFQETLCCFSVFYFLVPNLLFPIDEASLLNAFIPATTSLDSGLSRRYVFGIARFSTNITFSKTYSYLNQLANGPNFYCEPDYYETQQVRHYFSWALPRIKCCCCSSLNSATCPSCRPTGRLPFYVMGHLRLDAATFTRTPRLPQSKYPARPWPTLVSTIAVSFRIKRARRNQFLLSIDKYETFFQCAALYQGQPEPRRWNQRIRLRLQAPMYFHLLPPLTPHLLQPMAPVMLFLTVLFAIFSKNHLWHAITNSSVSELKEHKYCTPINILDPKSQKLFDLSS